MRRATPGSAYLRELGVNRTSDARAQPVGADDVSCGELDSSTAGSTVDAGDPPVVAAVDAVDGDPGHQLRARGYGSIDEQSIENMTSGRDEHVDTQPVLDRPSDR